MMAIEFDFDARTERAVPAAEARPAWGESKYVWFDLDAASDHDGAGALLRGLGLDAQDVASALDGGSERVASYRPLPGGLQLVVAAPEAGPSTVSTSAVAMVLGEGFCATVRRGPVGFLADVWRGCPDDFRRFAQSPGFLLYEFWDHLVAAYRRAADSVSDRARRALDQAFVASDEIFATVAQLTRDLLTLRRAMVGAREVLGQLTTRRSAVVPASTLPFLRPLVGSLDRLVADLAVDREILVETLNLYIGLVGHRTNRVINRLTVVSSVFLPLTFLCGVYGMNFHYLPELEWRYGYPLFWILSSLIVTVSLAVMKWRRWW
jgi:magnesium transporter